jgi:hypothetical protein
MTIAKCEDPGATVIPELAATKLRLWPVRVNKVDGEVQLPAGLPGVNVL